jgi:hypothetical protein
MISDEEGYVQARAVPLGIVWRNPLCGTGKAETQRRKQSLLRIGRTSQQDSCASQELRRQSQLGGVNSVLFNSVNLLVNFEN